MKTQLAMTIILGGAMLTGGCATKKYVRNTTAPIQAKVDQVGDQTNKNTSGLEDNRKEIKAVDERVFVRYALHPVGIVDARIETVQEGVPDVAGPVKAGIEGEFDQRLVFVAKKEYQSHGCSVLREDAEIDAAAQYGRAEGQRGAASELEPACHHRQQLVADAQGHRCHLKALRMPEA